MSDPTQMFTVEYDGEEGTVVINDFGVQEAIEIRSGLVDKAVRHAAVVELEKLGYTVVSPEGEPTVSRSSETDVLLSAARQCADEGLERYALRRYRKLDELLSSGKGTLPEAWARVPLPTDLREENR